MKGILHRAGARLRPAVLCIAALASGPAWAAHVAPGDLLITEVMANPAAVSDSAGEWLELFNATGVSLDLAGLALADDGSDTHAIGAGGPVVIDPGEYFILARSGDPALNGGLVADYVYDGFTLSNSADEIALLEGAVEIARLAYLGGSSFGVAGVSAEVAPGAAPPLTADDFQRTPDTFVYGAGDVGTPGAAGSAALALTPVPLPAAAWLLGAGLLGLAGVARQGRRAV